MYTNTATSHPVYEGVWGHVIPFAICQLMLGLDRRTIRDAAQKSQAMLQAFALATVGTILGSLVSFGLLSALIPQAWKLAAVFSATYVGGTINFLATADVVGLRDAQLLATAFSADMFAMAVYFAVLFYIGRNLPPVGDGSAVEKGGDVTVYDRRGGGVTLDKSDVIAESLPSASVQGWVMRGVGGDEV